MQQVLCRTSKRPTGARMNAWDLVDRLSHATIQSVILDFGRARTGILVRVGVTLIQSVLKRMPGNVKFGSPLQLMLELLAGDLISFTGTRMYPRAIGHGQPPRNLLQIFC